MGMSALELVGAAIAELQRDVPAEAKDPHAVASMVFGLLKEGRKQDAMAVWDTAVLDGMDVCEFEDILCDMLVGVLCEKREHVA